MVHGLEAEYYGRVKFAYLDADDPRTDALQRALGFYYQPELYLLDADGNVLKDIFLDDGLHMNEKGYAIWVDVLKKYLP